jgi:hypothetical protein
MYEYHLGGCVNGWGFIYIQIYVYLYVYMINILVYANTYIHINIYIHIYIDVYTYTYIGGCVNGWGFIGEEALYHNRWVGGLFWSFTVGLFCLSYFICMLTILTRSTLLLTPWLVCIYV